MENHKPLILITNDDGIHSPGLLAAAEAVSGLGELLPSAPIHQQTGMGRAFPRMADTGILEPVELCAGGQEIQGFGVHGSPAFSVSYGVLELAPRKPDLCISGINYGENLGTCVSCSGTLGAAFEANSHGIPAIAVSIPMDLSLQRTDDYPQADWEAAKIVLRHWAQWVLENGMPAGVDTLNISLPLKPCDPKLCRITTQSRQNYYEFIRPGRRDFGKPYALKSEISLHMDTLERDSDIYAVCVDNVVSVTPMSMLMGAPQNAAALFSKV